MVEELRSGLARALEALADVTRGQKPSSELERDVAELRERVEYLEDSLAASEARAEREYRRLSGDILRRVNAAIDRLTGEPRHQGTTKLAGRDDYRVRVGD